MGPSPRKKKLGNTESNSMKLELIPIRRYHPQTPSRSSLAPFKSLPSVFFFPIAAESCCCERKMQRRDAGDGDAIHYRPSVSTRNDNVSLHLFGTITAVMRHMPPVSAFFSLSLSLSSFPNPTTSSPPPAPGYPSTYSGGVAATAVDVRCRPETTEKRSIEPSFWNALFLFSTPNFQ